MRINTDRALADFERLENEIEAQKERLSKLEQQHHDLATFLRLAQQYAVLETAEASPAVKSAPTRTGRNPTPEVLQTPMTLKRDSGKRQTEVAVRLVQMFRPGEIFTTLDAAERLNVTFPLPPDVTRAHHLSSYLSREADAKNGVLDRLSVGEYRLRNAARALVGDLLAPEVVGEPDGMAVQATSPDEHAGSEL